MMSMMTFKLRYEIYINFCSLTEHQRIITTKYKKSTKEVGHVFLFFKYFPIFYIFYIFFKLNTRFYHFVEY